MALAVFYSIPVNQYLNDGYNMLPFGHCVIGCIVPEALAIPSGTSKVLHISHRKLILDAFWAEMTQDKGTAQGEYSLFTDTTALPSTLIEAADAPWREHWINLYRNAVQNLGENDKALFAVLGADSLVSKVTYQEFMAQLFGI